MLYYFNYDQIFPLYPLLAAAACLDGFDLLPILTLKGFRNRKIFI